MNTKLTAKTKIIDRKRILAKQIALATFALLCFGIATMIAVSASGQDAGGEEAASEEGGFDSIPLKASFRSEAAVKRMKAEARSFASTGKGNGGIVKVYFTQYVPGMMTAPDGLDHLSEIITDVNGFLVRANRSSRRDVARGLTSLTFGSMKAVATGNHHPSARIAATVVLGSLLSKPADLSRKLPPVPYKNALPVLVSLYENKKNADGIRAAALRGIHRHVLYTFNTMPGGAKKKLMTLMNELLDSKTSKGRSLNAHAYLQRYAVDVLDYLRPKGDVTLGKKLISISTAPRSPSLIALHSAARLGSMSTELANTVDDADPILASWSVRTLSALKGEIERLTLMTKRKEVKSQPRSPDSYLKKADKKSPRGRAAGRGEGMRPEGMMGGMEGPPPGMEGPPPGMEGMMGMDPMGMGMMGMGRPAPEVVQPPEIIASRRKLNHVLQQVHLGVTGSPRPGMPTGKSAGLRASVSDDQQAAISNWVESMAAIVEAINDKGIDKRADYIDMLEDQVGPLQEMSGDLVEKEDIQNQRKPGDPLDAALLGDDPFDAALLGE